jgi:hypothetical protein
MYLTPDGVAIALDATTKRGVGSTYIALLSSDPGVAPTMASLPEIVTPGYARQPVLWTPATQVNAGEPLQESNTALLTFGPFTANMLLDATWAALVDVATGTTGLVRWIWHLPAPANAALGESIQVPIGKAIVAIS